MKKNKGQFAVTGAVVAVLVVAVMVIIGALTYGYSGWVTPQA